MNDEVVRLLDSIKSQDPQVRSKALELLGLLCEKNSSRAVSTEQYYDLLPEQLRQANLTVVDQQEIVWVVSQIATGENVEDQNFSGMISIFSSMDIVDAMVPILNIIDRIDKLSPIAQRVLLGALDNHMRWREDRLFEARHLILAALDPRNKLKILCQSNDDSIRRRALRLFELVDRFLGIST